MRYEVRPDGSLANGRVFFDATAEPGEDAWDGMKVDQEGNLYLSGPGGLWVISPEGKHLGTNHRSGASSQHGLGRRRRQNPLLVRENRSLSNSIQHFWNPALTEHARHALFLLGCD